MANAIADAWVALIGAGVWNERGTFTEEGVSFIEHLA
jgi:hypothetical protein|tara:strand:+ start:1301 stop:1411 length:111 start_codon:yes stop_codon:yes gene_type:complete